MVEKFEKKHVPSTEPILLSIDDLRDAASAKLPIGVRGSSISSYTFALLILRAVVGSTKNPQRN